jgi:hypothetical protein
LITTGSPLLDLSLEKNGGQGNWFPIAGRRIFTVSEIWWFTQINWLRWYLAPENQGITPEKYLI